VPIINNVFIGNGKKVVVIGGGMAGLSAAYYMSRRGAGIELLEREKTVGGFCRSSIKNDKYILEYGPQYFYSIDTQIMKLARELSIDSLSESSRIDPNKRYIYDQGKFYKLPTSPFKMFTSSPLSILEKIRLAMEPFIKSKSTGMETVADFSKRRFGSGVLENIVGPVLSARFAGDPLCLEARAAVPELVDAELEEKSLLKKVGAFIPKIPEDGLLSFKWGMGTITARLEEEMRQKIMKGVFADAILSGGDGRYAVSINVSARELAADVVIIAVSAREAARLLMELSPEIVTPLMEIQYAPVVVVHAAFKKKEMTRAFDGMGFVATRNSGLELMGLVNSSGCFESRVRGQEEVMYCAIYGGAMDPGFIDKSDDEIKPVFMTDIDKALGISAEPSFFHVRRWPEAIPQYTPGHLERIAGIKRHLKKIPGIFLAGNYFSGTSLAGVLEHSRSVVDEATFFLKS